MRKQMIVETDHCTVEGVLQSECSVTGTRITTMVLEYPRAIHAQLLTHRVFSKNSSSSRAVPAKRAIEQVRKDPANYLWTENQKGMQGSPISDVRKLDAISKLFNLALESQIKLVEVLTDPNGLNVHKQNACRLLEPFQNIRVCLTSTEWENWDWLRIDPDAQGEIADLANAMAEVREKMGYHLLKQKEWHLPFTYRTWGENDEICYFTMNGQPLTLEQAINVSMSCAAQTSYRRLDDTLEKAEDMYDKLFSGKKVHASPSEHQATPIGKVAPLDGPHNWPHGVTALDREADLWSGNFRHWIQNRQLIPNHDKAKF